MKDDHQFNIMEDNCQFNIMVDKWTQLKFSDFFDTKNGMIEPTCEKLQKWKQAGNLLSMYVLIMQVKILLYKSELKVQIGSWVSTLNILLGTLLNRTILQS